MVEFFHTLRLIFYEDKLLRQVKKSLMGHYWDLTHKNLRTPYGEHRSSQDVPTVIVRLFFT